MYRSYRNKPQRKSYYHSEPPLQHVWFIRSSQTYFVTLLKEGELVFLCGICNCQHIPKGHILETFCLSDVIIYRQINGYKNQTWLHMNKTVGWEGLQFGMLIPAGMPLPAKVSTSREVKSGLRKRSFSKAEGHGSSGSKTSAELTNWAKRALMALFTTATKPDGRDGKCGGEKDIVVVIGKLQDFLLLSK